MDNNFAPLHMSREVGVWQEDEEYLGNVVQLSKTNEKTTNLW
jgi:hypothetical protein